MTLQLTETYTDLPVESRTAYRTIVGNNPVNWIDPYGEVSPVGVGLCIAATIYNVGSTIYTIEQLTTELEKLDEELNKLEKSCNTEEDWIMKYDQMKDLERQKNEIAKKRIAELLKGAGLQIPISFLCLL